MMQLRSKFNKRFNFLILLLLLSTVSFGQIKKPVTVTPTLIPPYPMYLSEYVAPGSQKCMVNLVFNDYNEPSWDVYLDLTIESSNLKIQTKPNFRPVEPVTLTPGVPVTIKGEDLYQYFNYDNLLCSGISKQKLEQQGKLPEGFYTFSFKVRDYNTGRIISNTGRFAANLSLNKPPRIIRPKKGKIIKPSNTQNFNINWLTQNANPQETTYKVHMYEVLDSSANPQQAISNDKALEIFESDPLKTKTMNYNATHPLLEKGKTYAFYVRAINDDGKDLFQNNGKSQVHWFHYGYPQNGHIALHSPEDDHGMTLREDKNFVWGPPSKLTDNQQYHYKLKIVKLEENENPKQAINDSAYHQVITQPIHTERGWSELLNDVKFSTGVQYAWQVKAYTEETQIAKSKVYTFSGPPFLEEFKAGNHPVRVTKTTTTDMNNLSGEGNIKFTPGGKRHKVIFKNIRLERTGAEIYLREGRVVAECKYSETKLNPTNKENGEAVFKNDSIILDKEDLKIKGHVEWELPHPTHSEEKAIVRSKTVSLKYNDLRLLGTAYLSKNNSFKLLDPMNFGLKYDTTSRFFINENRYKLHLNGVIELPGNVKGTQKDTVKLPFHDKQQMFFLEEKTGYKRNKIDLVPNSNIHLYPDSYTIDLSEKSSPGKKSGQPLWKGVYYNKFTLKYTTNVDQKNQLACASNFENKFTLSTHDDFKAWIGPRGLQFSADYQFNSDEKGFFNTFPSKFDHISLEIDNSSLTEGTFNGSIKIPVLSNTKNFTYTIPMSYLGFQEGHLDDTLSGKKFTFNKEGGNQKMEVTVNRAVFRGNRLLDMNIDINWPYIGIKMESLNHFRIWGNYKIGFAKPNGIIQLTQQKQGMVNGYEITVDHLGCGREGKLYSIGTSANIIMGEDIAGESGAPVTNLYSISKNKLLEGSHSIGGESDYYNVLVDESGDGSGSFSTGTNDMANLDSLKGALEQRLQESKNQLKQQLNQKSSAIVAGQLAAGTENNTTDDDLLEDNTESNTELNFSLSVDKAPQDVTKADILTMLDAISLFLDEEQQQKMADLKSFIETIPEEYLADLYEKLSDLEGLAKDILKDKVDEITEDIKSTITNETNKVKETVVDFIDGKKDSINNVLTSSVNKAVDSLAKVAVREANKVSENIDFSSVINEVKSGVKSSINKEIVKSINKAVEDSLTGPIKAFVDTSVNKRINGFIDSTITSVAYSLIEDQNTQSVDTKQIIKDAKDLIPDIAEDFQETFLGKRGEKIIIRLYNTGSAAVKNFSWSDVTDQMVEKLVTGYAETEAEDAFQQGMSDFVSGATGDSTAGDVAGQLAQNVDMDFSNIGQKLKNGEIDKIISFDPSYIKVETSVADFEGYVNFTKDDPVWGDSWQAELAANIKIEPSFQVNAKYINGTTTQEENNYKYWFLELGVDGLGIPISAISMTLDGAAGKVYHHMGKTEAGSDTYRPDKSTNFGAGLELELFDTPSKGKSIAFRLGMELALLEDGFMYEMAGEAWMGNKVDQSSGEITSSVGEAEGFLNFNSAESHFLGNFSAKVEKTPLLCAGGEMIVDINKKDWRVAIGTRPKPIYVDPLCTGNPIFQGWFDVSNKRLDMGLIYGFDFKAQSGWINIGVCKFRPWAQLTFEMGATTIVLWQPQFEVEEAHVWVDIYVGIGVKYKCTFSNGNLTIASVNVGGELLFTTIPETKLTGEAHGKITVLNQSFGFDLKVKQKF